MKLLPKFAALSMYQNLDIPENNGVVDPEMVLDDSDMMNILREIYSVDERSGFPKGDLAYYLSPDGNPQIKNWIETNLLRPRSIATSTSIENVSDDMIAEYAKKKGETADEYRDRLYGIYESSAKEIAEYKKQNVPANE